MPRFGLGLLTLVAGLSLALAAAPALATEDDDDEGSGVSVDVSLGGEGDAAAGNRPTHRPFNLHFAIGGSFALGDDLENHDKPLDDKGGQGTVGLDFVMIEPLAFSILGGFNAFAGGPDNAMRNVFIGAGLRLRLFADYNGAALDDGTIWGNLWIDAHINYDNYLYEHHGGYNIGLGYEFAIAKDFNMGPYVRFHHVPWGDGLNFQMLSIGLAISLGGKFRPDDQDGDGLNDDVDECPTEPEDKDGFEDEDGCPDTDNDEDGVLDVDDECPDLAGVAELNGCPDYDIDGDGIKNDDDQCPEEAEDKDEFEDEDGCPDPDNDGDGVLDGDDQCPTEVEDKDGFEDEDGCPDPDNDGDGIPDADDQCPLEAETKNGQDDEDGCPDLVRVVGNQIKILQKVYFATNKDTILEKSFPVLEEVAAVIVAKKDIKVRVEGHTDSKGSDKKNMDLSQRRAASVVKFLADKGVEEERLTAEGKGETMPIADNKRSAGRAENRRVEFHIIAPEPPPEEEAPAEEAPAEEAAEE
jgi:outer membrane protein OmpA-like peptidoglycan-associated protein